jgi:hypothetical protein
MRALALRPEHPTEWAYVRWLRRGFNLVAGHAKAPTAELWLSSLYGVEVAVQEDRRAGILRWAAADWERETGFCAFCGESPPHPVDPDEAADPFLAAEAEEFTEW